MGRWGNRGFQLGQGCPGAPDPGVDHLVEADQEATGDFVFDDLDAVRVVFVVQKGDGLPDKTDGSLEVPTEQGDGAILGDLSPYADPEVIPEILGSRPQEGNLGEVTGHGGLAGG